MNQKPSVGRIVHYTPPSNESGGKGQPHAAVVTHVWGDSCVNLNVLQDGSFKLANLTPTSVSFSDNGSPGTWNWPPRV